MRLLLLLALTAQVGCASIATQDYTQIKLVSSERGTRFYVDGRRQKRQYVMVNQRQHHEFVGKKSGCEEGYAHFVKGISGFFIFGNLLLFGGLIGMLVDVVADNFEVAKKTTYDVTPDCY